MIPSKRSGDRHRISPIALRMPAELNEWYRNYADTRGHKLHPTLIEALEAFRAEHENADCRSARHGQPASISSASS